MKQIEIKTPLGSLVAVATYSSKHLAIWRRDTESQAIFSELPRQAVTSLKASKRKIQAIYVNAEVI